MGTMRFLIPGPPGWSPGPGREHYLPEGSYFDEWALSAPEQLEHAARVTARTVARWADRYWVFPLTHAAFPSEDRERAGSLPADPGAHGAFMDKLFAWLERHGTPVSEAAVNLSLGDQSILEQHDGMPGVLALTPDEFAQLGRIWVRHGLPSDLFYPARKQRTVVEPVEVHGSVVRARHRYTPREWEQRDEAALAALAQRIPDEGARRQAFIEACRRFVDALSLRMDELAEPGRQYLEGERGEFRRLASLLREVYMAALRAEDVGHADKSRPDQSEPPEPRQTGE